MRGTEDELPSRSRRRILTVIGSSAFLAIAAGIVIVAWPAAEADNKPKSPKVTTAVIERGPLEETMRSTGSLGYGAIRSITISLGGVVTSLRPEGTIVGAGQELLRVNDDPVVLMLGDLPAWRPFTAGMDDGPDVLQLERNLASLGHLKAEPDGKFTGGTTAAVKRWQKSAALPQTGTVESNTIVFSPAEVRIAKNAAMVGDSAAGVSIGVSGTVKEISVLLNPNQQDITSVGAVVTVVLPDGTEAAAHTAAVGTVVEKDDGQNGKSLKVPVTVTLDDPAAAGTLDSISVGVLFTHVKADDALLAPVTALLARRGGDFAVEKLNGTSTAFVDVELGAFADGMVEVLSGAITEGDEVVVAQ